MTDLKLRRKLILLVHTYGIDPAVLFPWADLYTRHM